jgi:hypothetical protein
MEWTVSYLDRFSKWFDELSSRDRAAVVAIVRKLQEMGPTLPFPHSSSVRGSRHGSMRELRVQSGGKPLRILYAFDPTRTAILILGGDKTGDDRWYEVNVPKADKLYDEHLAGLESSPARAGKKR